MTEQNEIFWLLIFHQFWDNFERILFIVSQAFHDQFEKEELECERDENQKEKLDILTMIAKLILEKEKKKRRRRREEQQ